jgi:hypothetical protein
MKKMNSTYEAPKAEMVELYAMNDVMQSMGTSESLVVSEGGI